MELDGVKSKGFDVEQEFVRGAGFDTIKSRKLLEKPLKVRRFDKS